MAIQSSEESVRPKSFYLADPRVMAVWTLSFAAVLYAFLTGFHTVQDFDLGWQLATGRWVVQPHRVFSTDVFSYTAAGRPWIYPPLSGVIFYIAYLAGGYALLTWLGAILSAGTMALLLRNSIAVAALAVIAVPLIANRTQPRAEMFTTILFAAFISILWTYCRTGKARLWLLPVLMALWVNMHPGFVAGVGICVVYVFVELLGFSVAGRSEAFVRLGKAWPWLAATAGVTLLNPWGPLIYSALWRQQRAQTLHTAWIVEWESVGLSWASLSQALRWRDPQSSFWWLSLLAIAAIGIALWRKQWGAALLLAAATYFAIQHVRLQALFACIVVVVGGSLFEELIADARTPIINKTRRKQVTRNRTLPISSAAALGLTGVLVVLAGLRSTDLVTNRYYLRSNQLATFGTGLSWWYPERAVNFIKREKLPGNIFNGYALGGYLTWRLFPAYRDFIDSRALPFGPELFFRAYDLTTESPNSLAWQQEADARGINTIIVPLSRYQGMTLFPHLSDFCRSHVWKPVYMDEVSAVFVRVTPETSFLLTRLQIDCRTLAFTPPSQQTKSSMFNFAANAGGVLYSLERYPEALAELDRARLLFPDNASVHLFRGLVFQQMDRGREAETEFRTSVQLESSDEAWFDLGLFYLTQKRYSEAVDVFRQSTENSSRPHEMWMMLGQAYLGMRQPQRALEAFDKAVETNPFGTEGESLGSTFFSFIATGRAKAWFQLGDVAKAVSFQEEAVRVAPQDGKLWLGLANLYQVQGQISKAAEAKIRAQTLGARER